MQSKILFICLFLSILVPLLTGQETHFLDLSEAQNLAAEKSFRMKTLREDLLAADYRLRSATSRFKTQVSLNFRAPDYNETIRRFEDSLGVYYTPIRQFSYRGDLEISQPLPTDGRLFIRSGMNGVNDFQVDRTTVELNTWLGFEQPIEAFYSYNRIQAGFKNAELQYELRSKGYTREQLELNYQISQAFYNLVSAKESEKIARQTLQIQREATELAQNKYRAGVIAEVEALQMEVDLAQAINNYDIAQAQRISNANALKQLLQFPLSDSLAIESDLSYNIVEVDLEKALVSGLKHRLEIREQEIQSELADIQISQSKVNGQITGTISAYYNFIGVGDDPRSLGFSNTLDNAWGDLRNRPGNRGIYLDLTVPIWDWGVNWANVQAAKTSKRKVEYALDDVKVTVEREIRDAVANLRSSLKRLQLLEKNVQIAERSYTISQQRFANGEINSQSLALVRTQLSQAYITRLTAYISYKLHLLDIARITFYDFENDRSLVTE
jgi:outer membrane protein